MDLQKIKQQIKETQEIIDIEINQGNPAKSSLEMRRQQSLSNLEKLKTLEKEALKTYSSLYLVVGAKEKVLKTFENEGCLVVDHSFLAKDVSKFFWPQFRPGTTLNVHVLTQMNQYMDTIASGLGLDNFIRPKLSMDASHAVSLQTEEDLSTLLEQMFEKQLKNQANDSEGHVLQALVACQHLMKKYAQLDNPEEVVTFVVSVPSLNENLLEAYKNLLSVNVFTATFKAKLDVADDEKVVSAVRKVLNRKSE